MDSDPISSFARYEIKYLLTQDQYERLMPVLKEYMTEDISDAHTINNIYFDTDQYDVIRASIEKPVYKEKLRVRSYGTPQTSTSTVFIELKKKYAHVVYKRRIALPLFEARAFLSDGLLPSSTGPQITGEISCFMTRCRPGPKVVLSYDRIALSSHENSNLRITFDRNLRWRDTKLDLAAGPYGSPLLPDGRILMEVKAPESLPLWISRLLSENKIFSTSFSKIGWCYIHGILPKKFPRKL